MISIFITTFNEAYLLPFTIKHYRDRFPDCPITIVDNFSTDKTVEIAKSLGCEVKYFWTNNRLSDQAFIDVKNNCWKDATTRWVVVIDTDEHLDIWPKLLEDQEASIIRTCFVDMINCAGCENPSDMKHGIYYPESGKFLCFDRTRVKEINYEYGCHEAHPFGDIVLTWMAHRIYHYKWLSYEYVLKRYLEFGKRLSSHNLKNKLSYHYLYSKRKIKKEFNKFKRQAVKVK